MASVVLLVSLQTHQKEDPNKGAPPILSVKMAFRAFPQVSLAQSPELPTNSSRSQMLMSGEKTPDIHTYIHTYIYIYIYIRRWYGVERCYSDSIGYSRLRAAVVRTKVEVPPHSLS